jgi:hypothetical protein
MAISGGRGPAGAHGWTYFGGLGAGFMLLEAATLQRFVLLLGHPACSLTVTLFSLLLGTGLGSLISRRIAEEDVQRVTTRVLLWIAAAAMAAALVLPRVVDPVIALPLALHLGVGGLILIPLGVLLGMPLPGGMRVLRRTRPAIVPWGWGINGAFSVVGATLAISWR